MRAEQQSGVYRVAVIGGGISGLAAAHRLLEQSRLKGRAVEVLLLESGARLGGIVSTYRREGFLLEAGPDSFIYEKPEAIRLAERVKISSRLIETNHEHRRSFIARGRRLYPVPEGFQLLAPSRVWPFLTTGIFSWAGKARMALDLLLPRRVDDGEDESLASFVRRRLGREALERVAQPMVGGIYTADPELLSLRSTMPRFLEMERAHRSVIKAMWAQRRDQASEQTKGTSGARYGLFLTFDEGMQILTDRLADLLPEGCARLNTKVEALALDRSEAKWRLHLAGGESINADAVCLALPSYSAAALLRGVDAELARELDAIPYASTA
ncbi:MAG TPA: protoporphyrinogen oxidase, partial [Pyrinomonadaceae bacterium]